MPRMVKSRELGFNFFFPERRNGTFSMTSSDVELHESDRNIIGRVVFMVVSARGALRKGWGGDASSHPPGRLGGSDIWCSYLGNAGTTQVLQELPTCCNLDVHHLWCVLLVTTMDATSRPITRGTSVYRAKTRFEFIHVWGVLEASA